MGLGLALVNLKVYWVVEGGAAPGEVDNPLYL